MQEGMVLRGRRLPGAVPVVAPRVRPEPETPDHGLPTSIIVSSARRVVNFFGSVRRRLNDAFSMVMYDPDETSYEAVSMEETRPVEQRYEAPNSSTPLDGEGEELAPMPGTTVDTRTPSRPRSVKYDQKLSRTYRAELNAARCTIDEPASSPLYTPPGSDEHVAQVPWPVVDEALPHAVYSTPTSAAVPTREQYDYMVTLTGLSPVAKQPGPPKETSRDQVTRTSDGLTGLLPVTHAGTSTELAPTVVNNYSNCSFDSASSISKGKKIPKVPSFDDTKLDIEAYLANFEAMTTDWTPEEKLNLLRAKLTGKAAKILAALDLRGSPVTFNSLVQELERHYVGERSEWVAKLRDVRREDGEALDELAFRISLYSKRAYGSLQDDLGLQLYLALRDGPLGDKLFEVKDKPLPEVLQRAKSYETHLLALNLPTMSSPQSVATAYPRLPTQGERTTENSSGSFSGDFVARGRGRGTRGRGQPRYGSQDRRFGAGPRRCYVCKSVDHMWKECPQATAHFGGSAQPPNVSQNPESNF